MMPGYRFTPARSLLLVAMVVFALVGLWQWRGDGRNVDTAASAARSTAPEAAATGQARTDRRSDTETRDLSIDESRGGHTLSRHVGLSDEELRDRLRRERRISAASTYTDRQTAEAIVGRTLARHASRVREWTARSGDRPNLALDYRSPDGRVIGRSLRRGRSEPEPARDAVVVLRWRGNGYYVLTSYPEARR